MTKFLALYAGRTVGESRLIAISADAELVALVAQQLLGPQAPSLSANDSIPNMKAGTVIPKTDNESPQQGLEVSR